MSEAADDIGADIMRAMQGESEPVAAVVETNILPADTQADDTGPPVIEGAQETRARDENGRFAKAGETVQDVPAQAAEPAQQPTIRPPKSFTPAEKAEFLKASPLMQQAMLRRDAEIDAGKAQWDTKAERYNKLDAVLAPVRDRLTISAISDEQYIQALVRADEMLRGPQAREALQLLAQQYGIQPMQGQSGPPQQADPQMQAFQQLMAPLQQTVQQMQAQFQAQQQQTTQQAQSAIEQQIAQFANDPQHIYFSNVEEHMAKLISSGAAKGLDDAYEIACYANKEIRDLMAAAAPKAQPPQTRPAGPQVTGAQRGAAAKPNGAASNSSYEDDVRSAFEEVAGRV